MSRERIIKHLGTHTVSFIGGEEFMFVEMNSIKDDGRVEANWFEKVDAL